LNCTAKKEKKKPRESQTMSAKSDRFVVQRVQVKGKKVTINTVRLFATVPEPKLLLLFESAVDQTPSQEIP
jgi:hypothetical protein